MMGACQGGHRLLVSFYFLTRLTLFDSICLFVIYFVYCFVYELLFSYDGRVTKGHRLLVSFYFLTRLTLFDSICSFVIDFVYCFVYICCKFHLHILVFPFIYQFNSRIGILVLSASFQNLFVVVI